MNYLIHLLDQYGYIVLFFSLMLELIIIPIPNEILMSYVGFLVYQGKLNLYAVIIFGGLGGIIGVTISYWIGYKLGTPFFYKYGSKIHMGPDKIDKISRWNKRYGKRLLLFSYFIPGVRHLTSLFSGITRVSFKGYAFFAYIGVYLWVGTFITLGKIFGPKWEQFHTESKRFILIACILIAIVYVIYLLIKIYREKIVDNLLLLFEHTFKKFHSFLKIKILIFSIGVIFIGLFSLMIGLIQDFIANEFNQFNTIASMVIFYLFDDTWKSLMNILNYLTAWKSLTITGCLTLVWIVIMGKNKLLEVQYYLIGIIGALLFGKGLNLLFGQISGNKLGNNTFPSQQTFISIVIFVFFMYAIVRQCKKTWINMIVVTLTIFVLVSIAAARVYLHLQAPSDEVAGYVFGGVWVSFIILIVEVSRLLNLIKLSLRK
ncbi:MAG: VTT domain-containing protein [Bacillota bacterium]|nr:VTT domain-containing protein [Bacillota bacterium]MDP4154556.1 VTT domain-containing protein [Bacillota bacterium]